MAFATKQLLFRREQEYAAVVNLRHRGVDAGVREHLAAEGFAVEPVARFVDVQFADGVARLRVESLQAEFRDQRAALVSDNSPVAKESIEPNTVAARSKSGKLSVL